MVFLNLFLQNDAVAMPTMQRTEIITLDQMQRRIRG